VRLVFNKSLFNWTQLCQLHFNPIVRKIDLNSFEIQKDYFFPLNVYENLFSVLIKHFNIRHVFFDSFFKRNLKNVKMSNSVFVIILTFSLTFDASSACFGGGKVFYCPNWFEIKMLNFLSFFASHQHRTKLQ